MDEVNHSIDARRAARDQDKILEVFVSPLKPLISMQVAWLRMLAGGLETLAKSIDKEI